MTIPKLTPEECKRIAEAIPKHIEDRRKDEEDKRHKRGKYAPETGSCVSCSGTVSAVVRVRDTGRIGGPPGRSFIAHWQCVRCGLMYGKCPPTWGTTA